MRRINHRLQVPDIYSHLQWYYVTICTQGRACLFDIISSNYDYKCTQDNNGNVVVSATEVVQRVLVDIPKYYVGVHLDDWVIMPNHIHLIIYFDASPIAITSSKKSDLHNIIPTFKSISYKRIVAETTTFPDGARDISRQTSSILFSLIATHNTIWQKSFHDRIIRDDRELYQIRQYIKNNPTKWELDEYYQAGGGNQT